MNFIKNTVLLGVVLVLSYFTAEYFGSWYDHFSPQYDNSLIGVSKDFLILLAGAPFAYIFFLILIFKLFAWGNKNKWMIWLLVPAFLFFASGDLKHIYLPVALALIALGLATLLQKLFKKNYGSNV